MESLVSCEIINMVPDHLPLSQELASDSFTNQKLKKRKMNEQSEKIPLLFKKWDAKKPSLLITLTKWTIRAAIYVVFMVWITIIVLFPLREEIALFDELRSFTYRSVFGVPGSLFFLLGAPVLVIALLAVAYLIISDGEDQNWKKKSNYPRVSLWTFPALVEGPFGVVSAAELIGIILFSVYLIWALTIYTIRNLDLLSGLDKPSWEQSVYILKKTALRFGSIGLICIGFLFLPVSRGSVLLRYVHIPFEHAVRYHVWLGHLTMFLFSLHGLFYGIAWTMEGHLVQHLISWKTEDVANLAGVITLLAGLLMWATSFPGVRKINFELFFYTHQLYVVFVVFLALHVGDFIFCEAAAGIFLFMLDRFLRFCQSRKKVDILSAKSFPCGTLELVLSKPPNLPYNALGWVFLQVREISLLQWHPFSVSSSPMDGKNQLSVLIKVLGGWTGKLKDQILKISENGAQTPLSASVEGPYGHQSPYHLTYENLIFVAGGIGISPFLAILSDILHRKKDGKPCRPEKILIVWAVKTSDELPLLETVEMDSICPFFSQALSLEIQTYVTRQSEPQLEEGKVNDDPTSPSIAIFQHSGKHGTMLGLAGTGNIVWSGMYVVASTIGLVVVVGLVDMLYINAYNITFWWIKALVLIACMISSVLIFGGFTIGLWHLWERRASANESEKIMHENTVPFNHQYHRKSAGQKHYTNSIRYGERPDLGEIFRGKAERWGGVDIGVIVCGPWSLEISVARECRTNNLNRRHLNQPVFHFHTHSFDL